MALDLRLQACKLIAPEMDKNKLLLLGLNLLNKGLNLPCAVVQPQAKTAANASASVAEREVKSPGKSLPSSPMSSTADTPTMESSRKRKRDSNADISDAERREKRKMMNRVSAQSARDRKRDYVDSLEKKVALLEEQNKKLEEENSVLKEHTSSLTQEKEQLAEKLDHQADDLKALVKETLLQEPFWLGSAAPRLVSLQQKRFLKQLFLLRVFLAFSSPTTASTGGSGSPGDISSSTEQPLSTTERIPLVGSHPVQVEPTNELKEMQDLDCSCSPLLFHGLSTANNNNFTMDLDFCDSLLTVPNTATTCADMSRVSQGLLDCDVEGFLQSACTEDLDESLNLESFLSLCSPEY